MVGIIMSSKTGKSCKAFRMQEINRNCLQRTDIQNNTSAMKPTPAPCSGRRNAKAASADTFCQTCRTTIDPKITTITKTNIYQYNDTQ